MLSCACGTHALPSIPSCAKAATSSPSAIPVLDPPLPPTQGCQHAMVLICSTSVVLALSVLPLFKLHREEQLTMIQGSISSGSVMELCKGKLKLNT